MGRDKALVSVDGRTLCLRTAELLAAVAGLVVEVGPGYTSLPRAIEPCPHSGPLAAMAAGTGYLLEAGHSGPALVVATDLPRLTTGLLALLASWPGPGSVVPLDGGGRPQPLCARYSPAALAAAAALVEAGDRSMMSLLDHLEPDVTWLPASGWIPAAGRPDALVDVDTPEDLAGLDAGP